MKLNGHTMEPPCVRSPLLEDLRADLLARQDEFDQANFRIRGIWTTRYQLRLLKDSTPFDLQYVLVQTDGMGCCYYPTSTPALSFGSELIGASVFDAFDEAAFEIAALDAAYAALPPVGALHRLSGENYEKARSRAQLISAEARRLLPEPRSGEARRVGLVGVVGEVLHEVRAWPGVEVLATDYAANLVDREMEGVAVGWGDETNEMVASVDVAVVTGMTLANGTLAGLVEAAREAGTRLVLFAETGSHFARRYLELGVDAVVAEEFPFYLSCGGPSRVRVARRPSS